MRLTSREQEGLLINQAGYLAQKRLARGLRLNYTEAIALIACQIQELARDGSALAELEDKGCKMLGRRQVMPGVPEMITDVGVEPTFLDGTKLVTLSYPIRKEDGDLNLALYGSFLPVPDLSVFKCESEEQLKRAEPLVGGEVKDPKLKAVLLAPPGQIVPASETPLLLNKGRKTKQLRVISKADRPIQVASHYVFIEANKYLHFDREQSYGMRLNIPSGAGYRFEPGEEKDISLVEIAGNKVVQGFNNLCNGKIDKKNLPEVMKRVKEGGFGNFKQPPASPSPPCLIPRTEYIQYYGPTVGDKVKLGDTCLVIEVEKDYTVYGEENRFGAGRNLRDGMGQANYKTSDEVLDVIITNALIIDAVLGIVKADIGIKGNTIVGIGKAGNPDTMEGVDPNLIVGCATEAISGESMIVTAGGIDSHVHFICPQIIEVALTSGITSIIGGGTGPANGTRATTCTPGPEAIKNMIQSTDAFPLNFGFSGKGNTSYAVGDAPALVEQIAAGAMSLKVHEDWGTTPAVIDTSLRVADTHDIQIMIHTDTFNESCCLEQTVEAIKGRAIHTYHTEGAGGGHAPDIIRICSYENVLPSSTNPTRPYTKNTVDEALDMCIICHNLDKNIRDDLAFAESRIRAETVAAEDVLHDMGALSMYSSDAQAMGRVGEVISRTWQTADKMKLFKGKLPEDTEDNDNFRVKRYVAKYTINPAIAHGIAHVVGSVEVGKMADLVIWKPSMFGVKPDMILKGGQAVNAQMGTPNASIPTPEPLMPRSMFGSFGVSIGNTSVVFVSKLSIEKGTIDKYGISKSAVAVSNIRNLTKKYMVLNDTVPSLEVNPETFRVYNTYEKDGKKQKDALLCPPADVLPLSQMYSII